jgi:hypothetical protein
MKYLQPSFTIAVTDRTQRPRSLADIKESVERRQLAKRPHAYLNGGAMCQVCGLGCDASIHQKRRAHEKGQDQQQGRQRQEVLSGR